MATPTDRGASLNAAAGAIGDRADVITLHAALEHAPVAAFGVDAGGRLRFFNAAGRSFLGAEPGDLPLDWSEALATLSSSGGLSDGDADPWGRLLSGERVTREPVIWLSPGGEARRCYCDGAPIDAGDPSGATALIYLSPASEEIEPKDPLRREVGEVAASFARTHLKLVPRLRLALHWADDARCVEALSSALDDLEEPAKLSRRLLSFAGRRPWIEEEVALGDVFEIVRDAVAGDAPAGVSFAFEPAPELSVLCDRAQFETALLNLVVNARDAVVASGAPGVVTVRAATRDAVPERLEITVFDDGPGLPPEQLAKVKAPFNTTRCGRVGAGVGLPIAEGFCNRIGGDLTLSSTPGRGLAAVMRLPA